MLNIGDKVRLIDDYKQLREGSCYKQREFYAKLAVPDREYTVEFITLLKEVYLKGEVNYFRYNLLEKC